MGVGVADGEAVRLTDQVGVDIADARYAAGKLLQAGRRVLIGEGSERVGGVYRPKRLGVESRDGAVS